MKKPTSDITRVRSISMHTPTQLIVKPQKRQINTDGKIHRKNRKKNEDRVEASGYFVTYEQRQR